MCTVNKLLFTYQPASGGEGGERVSERRSMNKFILTKEEKNKTYVGEMKTNPQFKITPKENRQL